MPVGKIITPTVQLGTVFTPGLWQQIIDNANAAVGATNGYVFREDFDGRLTAALTATDSVVGKFRFTTLVNGSVDLTPGTPEANTLGYLSMSNTGGAAPTIVGKASALNIGTDDFYFATRIKLITAKTNLAIVPGGFMVGFITSGTQAAAFAAGSDQANWRAYTPDSIGHDSTVAVSTSAYFVMEMIRATPVGGTQTLTYYINGSQVFSVADSTSMANHNISIETSGNAIGSTEFTRVDFVFFAKARPTSG